VRATCLRDELEPTSYPSATGESGRIVVICSDTLGIWGGSTSVQRARLRGLEREEAARRLERAFPRELERRIDPFRQKVGKLPRTPTVRRIIELLEEREGELLQDSA